MSDPLLPHLSIDQFHYDLPPERIAAFPAAERDGSKLLIYSSGKINDDRFPRIKDYLPAASLLVFNNTRVIHARLRFKRVTGAVIEILCLEPSGHLNPELSFRSTETVTWNCIVGNLRKWKDPQLTMEVEIDGVPVTLTAIRRNPTADGVEVEFSWNHSRFSFAAVLEKAGELPIPPYLNRDTTEIDELRYNTVYAEQEGSVAAPTAGLHFTEKVLDDLQSNGMAMGKITLHVGAGTFKPVKPGAVSAHEMHEERLVVSLGFLRQLLQQLTDGNPVIPVGTTAVRTLESIYWLGVKIFQHPQPDGDLLVEQWLPYQQGHPDISSSAAVQALISYLQSKQLSECHAFTRIMIVPGYRFKIIDGLVTNFHQPGSSLLLLIAALIGDDWRKIYQYALDHDFRFLSYGDSSLLLPKQLNS
ncbi:MAG: S-adenosylmethionine:tRNA ribosyltransferase-isomerase [Bacteroidia bacterium]